MRYRMGFHVMAVADMSDGALSENREFGNLSIPCRPDTPDGPERHRRTPLDKLVETTSWFMMPKGDTIGAFEAKTRLGELLERVGRGASFTITKHDRPVARLIGYQEDLATQRAEAGAAIRAQRQAYKLGGLDSRSLREEGRA